jgi:hypothetical protein
MEPVFNEFMEHLYEVGCYLVTSYVTLLLYRLSHLVYSPACSSSLPAAASAVCRS